MSVPPSVTTSLPGFFRSSWLVAAKDLRMEWRTFERLAAMALFSLVVLVIFNFAFDLATVRRLGVAKLVPGVLWITLVFSGIIGFIRSFQLEHRRDSMIGLMLAPSDRAAIFLGTAAGGMLLWVFLWNPDLGAARDWDLFAPAAFPLTAWGAYLMASHLDEATLETAAVTYPLSSFLVTAPWIAENSVRALPGTRPRG